MTWPSVPEPLAHLMERQLNVNAFRKDWPELFKAELAGLTDPTAAAAFRNQLAEAILHNRMTPEQYEKLTGEDFDTPEDLNAWLRELWKLLYGEQPITLS